MSCEAEGKAWEASMRAYDAAHDAFDKVDREIDEAWKAPFYALGKTWGAALLMDLGTLGGNTTGTGAGGAAATNFWIDAKAAQNKFEEVRRRYDDAWEQLQEAAENLEETTRTMCVCVARNSG